MHSYIRQFCEKREIFIELGEPLKVIFLRSISRMVFLGQMQHFGRVRLQTSKKSNFLNQPNV